MSEMKKENCEPWKMPDGRQMTWQALQAMGCTPGDVGERMREFYFDPDPNAFQNFSLKGVEIIEDHKAGSENDSSFEAKQQEQKEFDDNKRLEEQRFTEERRLEQQRLDEKFREKKAMEDKLAAERRQQEEAANRGILGGMAGLMGFGLTLGLAPTALDAAGKAMSGSVNSLNNPMMVASNNGGGLLAMARGAFDIMGPGNDKDIQLKGPGMTANFTPGAPVPEFDMGEGMSPTSPLKKMGVGLSGPGMTMPGMG